ncbi:hypothetical protein [Paracoccus tibetensis]|uniref:Uncharacterized protein n=1 Tax=Paracoccus tibetensis TaxID=336292 RepID=A0A1G5DEM0_9RHOB|nr:hypothetical protein [Paracoccus tibetensis]SCY12987.1 hypothetical protein SAMN05660710_00771 [Paracoccus tibetensis]
MTEITASERRLSAALDRIDQLLETGSPAAARQLAALTAERDALQAQLAAAQAEDMSARLQTLSEQAARLAAANEDLMAANRQLIEAQETGGIGADETREALEAEIEALRAARTAEMTQMGDIMAELERLLAEDGERKDGES